MIQISQYNSFITLGNAEILKQHKVAFLCSRKCFANIVLKSYDWAIEQREKGICVISGFHSRIEKDVFHFLLKGAQPIILALARGMRERLEPEIQEALDKNRLLIIAAFDGTVKRVTATAPSLLKGTLKVTEFVNADLIAQGLSGFQPEGAVFHAGRIMLERIHYLARKHINFAFETTLASRSFAPWINELRKTDYDFHLVFLWLPNEDFAIARVAGRVRMGGHNVPEETIRRRYHAGEIFSDSIVLWQIHGFFMTTQEEGIQDYRLMVKKKKVCL